METGKAILAVSFGTSYEETRRKTIDRIEADMQAAHPQHRLYRAWTSGMIRRKLEKRDGIRILDVEAALRQMAGDGIREVLVQPTHVINGIENEQMQKTVSALSHLFQRVLVGSPLLSSQKDNETIARLMAAELAPQKEEALVLMGHGSEHYSNAVYAALDYLFKDLGHGNIFMGTVEGYPGLDSVMKQVKALGVKQILLSPFMIVAGDHAQNDLAGEEEDSWKSRFEAEGYSVRCVLKGLGEYEGVRRLLLAHMAEAAEVHAQEIAN